MSGLKSSQKAGVTGRADCLLIGRHMQVIPSFFLTQSLLTPNKREFYKAQWAYRYDKEMIDSSNDPAPPKYKGVGQYKLGSPEDPICPTV